MSDLNITTFKINGNSYNLVDETSTTRLNKIEKVSFLSGADTETIDNQLLRVFGYISSGGKSLVLFAPLKAPIYASKFTPTMIQSDGLRCDSLYILDVQGKGKAAKTDDYNCILYTAADTSLATLQSSNINTFQNLLQLSIIKTNITNNNTTSAWDLASGSDIDTSKWETRSNYPVVGSIYISGTFQ